MDEQSWLKVSLTVEPELAEPVSEVLARFAPNGVVIESSQVKDDPFGPGDAVGPLIVSGYIPIDEDIESKRQKVEESLWYLGRIQELPQAEFEIIAEENWMYAWKQHYLPVTISPMLVIAATWAELEAVEDRIVIRIEPGMAFGTGTHPTTQLVLKHLENHLEEGMDVIDVGCGSGILSIASVMMGAGTVVGVDIDKDFRENAILNAELNNVAGKIVFGQGSVDELLAGDYSIQSAPVVLANILDPVLIKLLNAGMADLVEPGGKLILSGIYEERWKDLQALVNEKGLTVIEMDRMGDWTLIVAQKPA